MMEATTTVVTELRTENIDQSVSRVKGRKQARRVVKHESMTPSAGHSSSAGGMKLLIALKAVPEHRL